MAYLTGVYIEIIIYFMYIYVTKNYTITTVGYRM